MNGLIVHIDGYLETDLPLCKNSLYEAVEQMIKWAESRGWYIMASFKPVGKDGKEIELQETKA